MISDNNGAHLAWAATFNGEQDVYYAHISLLNTKTQEPQKPGIGKLLPPTPNPFSAETTIRYETAIAGQVKVLIFNQLGVLVRTLTEQAQMPGNDSLTWNAQGDQGQELPNGLYFCRLAVDGAGADFQKLVLMRK